MSADVATDRLERTPLHDLNVTLGAKMVPFAGYDMPVHYALGILKEHQHTRSKTGLFDVSHMGQVVVEATDANHATAAAALERLVPADVLGLAPGQQRYSQLLNDDGGTIDDLMITRSRDAKDDGRLFLVLNASRKAVDIAHIEAHLPSGVRVIVQSDRALLALQGPGAVDIMRRLAAPAADLAFMTACTTDVAGIPVRISRSGYTGEDGFEISTAGEDAVRLAQALLDEPEVEPIGLGARDSLRLEAGLCLYGHELDETTSPIEAALSWSIPKRRRIEGGFPGAARIAAELAGGLTRLRVGIRPEGRAPARDGTEIYDANGARIGVVTSGGFGPTLNHPIAMGYVATACASPDTPLGLMVRGRPLPAKVQALPFVPARYVRHR
jgi:aminomethyltransferase